MKCRNVFAVAVLAGTCVAANGQVLISEVVDGPLSGGNPKFLEIFNASATQSVTLGAGWKLRIYSNGGTAASTSAQYDFGGNSGANAITLLPGQTFTIANTANGGGTGWTGVYGIGNQPTVFSGTFPNGNGDDAYTIEFNDAIVDVFGQIGNAPTCNGGTWNYQDSYARRNLNVCAPNAVFTPSEWTIPGSDALEAGQVGVCGAGVTPVPAVWTTNLQNMTSPNSHANVCASGNDCNNNGFPDANDIATGRSRDCNANGLPDECDIATGASLDCNGNAIPDSCEIAGNSALDCNGNGALDSCELVQNPALDCNTNNILDTCDIAAGTAQDVNSNGTPDSCEPFLYDCNGNQTEDATDISSGTSQDCNLNAIPDECEIADGRLTDVDGNGIADACEGAYVGEAAINATVQPDPFGVRNLPNGEAFMNIEGADLGTFASYGGLRFDLAPITDQFDLMFGTGAWTVDRAYLYMQQSNAAFTVGGDVEIVWTDNDSINFAYDANPETTFFGNYATDYTDLAQITTYTFVQGTINNNGSGTIEAYQIAGSAVTGPGAASLQAELAAGSGRATILLNPISGSVAATYAGRSNNTWSGPQLVVFAVAAGGCGCAADYNQDGGVDGADVESFFSDWSNSVGCADVNVDGGIDGGDVESFFVVWSNGGC